ncbi:hypothetical protein [[Pseudomonas] boreopolis]|uniref:hypothetical protein n=1 Tax=Xanthomonas boreopolis TaxID=86183 RepID=UPI003D59C7FA
MTKPLPSPEKPPRGTADKLRRWAADGTPQKVMARRLGVGVAKLKQWLEEHEGLQAAYDEGVEEEHQMLLASLRAHMASSPTPAIFLLKARHGYREGDQTGQANKVQVTFNLPGAAPREQWLQARVIEPEKLPHDD